MIKIGLIGYGYWGPNLARNFNSNPDLELQAICDFSPDRLQAAAKLFPQAKMLNQTDEMFSNNNLDAIAVATPVSTHHDLALRALRAGKHVLVEKPLASTSQEAQQLVEEAESRGRLSLHTARQPGCNGGTRAGDAR